MALLILAMLCSGCASAIRNQGRFHEVLKRESNRGQIRAALGQPVESGNEGAIWRNAPYDDFVLRGPIYDISHTAGADMAAAVTCGLSELIAVPEALWWFLTDRGYRRVRILYEPEAHDYSQYYWIHFVGSREKPTTVKKKDSMQNQRAALDAGTAFCYELSVIGPARVSAGRWAE